MILNVQICILMFPFISMILGDAASKCDHRERSMFYLEAAVDMISKAKSFIPVGPALSANKPVDCEEILELGHNKSGVYTIRPRSRVTEGRPLDVYCDMDTDGGGWTVIQRRGNFKRSSEYFFKEWVFYKNGFGDVKEDFWLGNDNIFALTSQRLYSVRFDLKAVDGETKYALYETFWIEDEGRKYSINIQNYSGDAGDSMNVKHNGQKFSTKDQDNDSHKSGNCALLFKGGWWYNECHDSNLNGLYLLGKHESQGQGVNWKTFKGHNESLLKTEIKIRSKDFRKSKAEK